jgi:MFS transporter, DHA1 family, tetracycline resistance protein
LTKNKHSGIIEFSILFLLTHGETMQKSRLLPIFLVVFIDLLGFSLILPLLPFYAETYGATPLIVGLLTASYAAAQFIGAPVLGRLSDRYGRRPLLLVSIAGTLAGFLLLGFADPLGRALAGLVAGGDPSPALTNGLILFFLFVSRMIDGLTGGNITVAQAYISDVTDAKDRAKGLGMIGAAFGLGFILGPAIGGLLSTYGYAFPAFAAATLAAINLVMVAINLPESLTPEIRARIQAMYADRPRPSFSFNALWAALNRPRVGPLLHIRFFFGMSFAMFQTMFPLFAQYRLGLDVRQTGFVLAYVGVLSAVVQGFGVGRVAKRFPDRQIILASSALMAAGLLAWAFTPNLWLMLVVMIPLAMAGGTLNTIVNSALTQAVYIEEVGGTLGLSSALESLTRVISPTLGGVLFSSLGAFAPGVFGAFLMGWVTSFAYRRLFVNPDPPLPDRPVKMQQSALESS